MVKRMPQDCRAIRQNLSNAQANSIAIFTPRTLLLFIINTDPEYICASLCYLCVLYNHMPAKHAKTLIKANTFGTTHWTKMIIPYKCRRSYCGMYVHL
jgi:hypothetical protein